MNDDDGFSDAAPLLGRVRPSTCTSICPRSFRRRGPRSEEALQRRAARYHRRRPEEPDVGEPIIETPSIELNMQPLRILSCNIRSLVRKLGELIVILGLLNINFLCIQESWLDASTKHLLIPNFQEISRKDRKDGPNRGGVITYARDDLNNIGSYIKSKNAERTWDLLQRNTGSIAICNWYLPPGNSLEEIESLKNELDEMNAIAGFVIIVGDMFIMRHASVFLGEIPREAVI